MTNPIVTLRNIAMLLPLRGQEETLFYLEGIHIEPHHNGGALLIATNGCAMGVIYDEEASVAAAITWLPSRALVAACKRYKPEGGLDGDGWLEKPRAPVDGEMIELTSPTWGGPLEAGIAFPQWREPLKNIAIDAPLEQFDVEVAEYFSKVAHFSGATLCATPFRPPHTTAAADKITPLVIASAELPNFVGLLAPLRTPPSALPYKLPDWLDVQADEGEQPSP